LEINREQKEQNTISKHELNVVSKYDRLHLGGTSLGASVGFGAGGINVFNGFGGAINSFGGDGISILGTRRVNGFAQPARSRKEIATIIYLISLPPSSMACQAIT